MDVKHKGYMTPNEVQIMTLYTGKDKPSVFQIAAQLEIDPDTVYRAVSYWTTDPLETVSRKLITEPKESTMATKDKNKEERDRTMKKLRDGDPVYSVGMDRIRGMLPELEQGECFIIQKQGNNQAVNIRIGDVAVN
jgi:hypothetical protein